MATEKKLRDSAKAHADKNPKVDLDAVTEALERVGKLRKSGVPGPSYNLVNPYGRGVQHSAGDAPWTTA